MTNAWLGGLEVRSPGLSSNDLKGNLLQSTLCDLRACMLAGHDFLGRLLGSWRRSASESGYLPCVDACDLAPSLCVCSHTHRMLWTSTVPDVLGHGIYLGVLLRHHLADACRAAREQNRTNKAGYNASSPGSKAPPDETSRLLRPAAKSQSELNVEAVQNSGSAPQQSEVSHRPPSSTCWTPALDWAPQELKEMFKTSDLGPGLLP